MLLLASEKDALNLSELFLALNESANYFTLAGLNTTAGESVDQDLPSSMIIALYDAFEILAEQMLGNVPSLMISWNDESLRLTAETSEKFNTEHILLPVSFKQMDDILYVDILARKGGDAA